MIRLLHNFWTSHLVKKTKSWAIHWWRLRGPSLRLFIGLQYQYQRVTDRQTDTFKRLLQRSASLCYADSR